MSDTQIELHKQQAQAAVDQALKSIANNKVDKEHLVKLSHNERALQLVILGNHVDLIKMIFPEDNEEENDKDIAFGFACESGNIEIVKYLHSVGANVHVWNGSALYAAAIKDHIDVVKFLLSNGVNINAKDGAAFVFACGYASTEMVEYLISMGADIHADDDKAIVLAAAQGKLEIVKLLLSLGLNIHAHYGTALSRAQEEGQVDVVRFIKDYTSQ